MQAYHDVEHSYENKPVNTLTNGPATNQFGDKRSVESKVKIDQVLAKVAYGDEELKDNQLLENPDTGDIQPLNNPVTHTYTYREIASILREQQHTVTDFMYKLFLVSINFAKLRQAKSYPVFKALLHRVKVNSCEVLFSTCLSCFKLRALISYLELSADMNEDSLISDHIPDKVKKRPITNNLRYQSYDPAYDHPPGISGQENDEGLNRFATDTLRKIELNKPEQASEVPKYLYRILSVLYTCYNKQDGNKITTGVGRSIAKCEARICRALVIYSQGKRSKTALNEMIKELEQVEFAKNMNKKLYR